MSTRAMPPRPNAAVAEHASAVLSPLPVAIVLYIFSLLPVDVRLRCMEVCRGWRSVLSERNLWTRLDLTAASGVRVPAAPHETLDSLLRCAAARAGGGLQSLHVDAERVSHAELLAVTAASAGALRELHAPAESIYERGCTPGQVEALLAAAPLLRVFAVDLDERACIGEHILATRRMLRNEAPFGPLRVRRLYIFLYHVDEAGVVAFAGDLAAHASLNALFLHNAPLNMAAALDAVVDAALLARHLVCVTLLHCHLSPASAPALARLLGGNALATLTLDSSDFLDAPAAALLAAALLANVTLTSLTLTTVGVFDDAAAAASLLGALTSHASLRELSVRSNSVEPADQAVAGALLGALVAANAPALTQLEVSGCSLGDAGLRAFLDALPHNTHLRALTCFGNHMSAAFARDVLLPAVRANTGLRFLAASVAGFASAREAEALVYQRPPAN
jgi:SAM-dependent methyltransferase